MRFLNRALLSILLSFLPLGLAVAQQASPVAITPQETSGMVGITVGQTARLNALNPGVPAPLATGARCPAQVSIVDDQGNVLKTASIIVDPGKSVNLDFTASSGRLEIRAVISFTQPAPVMMPGTTIAVPVSLCNLVPTLEVFDTNSLRTESVLTDFKLISYPFLMSGMMAGSGTSLR